MKRNCLILTLVIVLSALLRFYKLGEYPSLNADEAAIGYNAYSLIQTGKDEHGNPWPIHFQSFNDYKPGLYFYLVLPFVKLLGLNELAVRFPNAILGVLSVFLIYFLANKLFPDKEFKIWGLNFGIWASLMLAVSPWHIHFSRGGWEVNVSTFMIVFGVLLFLKGLKNLKFLYLSVFVFCLSFYTYHSARVVVPLLILGLTFIFFDFFKDLRKFFLVIIFGVILITPLFKEFISKRDVFSRAYGVGLTADPGPLARINEQRGEHQTFRSFVAISFHNKLVNYSLLFLENWAKHFSGNFLFLTGDDIQRNKVPETGQMYFFDFVFLVIGIIFLLNLKKENKKSALLILLWLIISPTASALTFQSPNALRSQNMVIPLTLISSFGMFKVIKFLNRMNLNLRIVFYIFIFLLVFWNFLRYQHMYWIHMAKEFPYSSQYGVKELVDYLKEVQANYNKIIVTDAYDQPYILFLFYLQYPPSSFQYSHTLTPRDKFGFSTVRSFDKYEFRPIVWDVDRPGNPNSLLIGTEKEIPKEANIVKEIYGTNDHNYFNVVAN